MVDAKHPLVASSHVPVVLPGQIKLFCKGADNVIYNRMTPESKTKDWLPAEAELEVRSQEDRERS